MPSAFRRRVGNNRVGVSLKRRVFFPQSEARQRRRGGSVALPATGRQEHNGRWGTTQPITGFTWRRANAPSLPASQSQRRNGARDGSPREDCARTPSCHVPRFCPPIGWLGAAALCQLAVRLAEGRRLGVHPGRRRESSPALTPPALRKPSGRRGNSFFRSVCGGPRFSQVAAHECPRN